MKGFRCEQVGRMFCALWSGGAHRHISLKDGRGNKRVEKRGGGGYVSKVELPGSEAYDMPRECILA